MNPLTKATSTQAFKDQSTNTHADDITRIANALERIADNQEHLIGCAEEELDLRRVFNKEFALFSRHGFGL
jgi:hypothetical protein